MSFEFQSQPPEGYTELTAEHRMFADWIARFPRRAFAECPDHRFIDRKSQAVAYRICGVIMGEGSQFALVHRKGIARFVAMESVTPARERVVRLSSVEMPEAFLHRRDHFQALMLAVSSAYTAWRDREWPRSPVLRYELDGQPWRIVPTPGSKLYWLEQAKKMKAKAQPKALAVWRALTSPLASIVALVIVITLSLAQVRLALPAVLLVACWLWWRFSRYDDDLVLRHWMVGKTKLKNPVTVYKTISRLMTPQPLDALRVTLTPPRSSEPGRFKLEVLNTSWYPAAYFSISAKEVADLVAPGFSDSLRAANKGAIDKNALEAVFPDLRRRWLLPRQTVQWHVEARTEFPHENARTARVVATVAISRRVSGESKHGAQSFLLPVKVLAS